VVAYLLVGIRKFGRNCPPESIGQRYVPVKPNHRDTWWLIMWGIWWLMHRSESGGSWQDADWLDQSLDKSRHEINEFREPAALATSRPAPTCALGHSSAFWADGLDTPKKQTKNALWKSQAGREADGDFNVFEHVDVPGYLSMLSFLICITPHILISGHQHHPCLPLLSTLVVLVSAITHYPRIARNRAVVPVAAKPFPQCITRRALRHVWPWRVVP
jgi:hypothetical protein